MKFYMKYVLIDITIIDVNEQLLQPSVIKDEQGAKIVDTRR